MIFNVVIEGQTIPVPEEIGDSDDAVKRALTPFYPEVANAMITRVVKDETTTITVVKKAGSKGQSQAALAEEGPITALIAAPGGKNAAVELYEDLRDLPADIDPAELLALSERVERALQAGERELEAEKQAASRLISAAPRPAPYVPEGF